MARSNGGALRSRVTATLQQLRRAASSGGACCVLCALQRSTALPFASKFPAARVAFFAPCSVCVIAIRQQASGGACCVLCALQRYAALPFASKLPAARVAFFAPCSGMRHCHSPVSFRRRMLRSLRPAAVCGFAIRQQASGGACCPLLARDVSAKGATRRFGFPPGGFSCLRSAFPS